jgi:hypothetical protein
MISIIHEMCCAFLHRFEDSQFAGLKHSLLHAQTSDLVLLMAVLKKHYPHELLLSTGHWARAVQAVASV